MFVGISIPSAARSTIRQALDYYQKDLAQPVPENAWHMTVLWVGSPPEAHNYIPALTKSLRQSFTMTVTLTHLGRGKKPSLLWAYAIPSLGLHKLRKTVLDRFEAIKFPLPVDSHPEFIPHITVGHLSESLKNRILPDHKASITFPVPALDIYEAAANSEGSRYTSKGRIPLA